MDDASVVEAQIGRPPRAPVTVEARCHLGLPVVIDVPPILDDGTPFPTTHWLTCPLATVRISRLESQGGVKDADRRIAADPDLAVRWSVAMNRYAEQRSRRLPADHDGPVPTGGVAGSQWGVKCLHAQFADTAAGNTNPIGAEVAAEIEPLDCASACVHVSDGVVVRDPSWVEPMPGDTMPGDPMPVDPMYGDTRSADPR